VVKKDSGAAKSLRLVPFAALAAVDASVAAGSGSPAAGELAAWSMSLECG